MVSVLGYFATEFYVVMPMKGLATWGAMANHLSLTQLGRIVVQELHDKLLQWKLKNCRA